MLDHIREDDIIVVFKLDRLARSTRDFARNYGDNPRGRQ
jgi:DNA invertase Pin-like site-specific DNA recombinase